MGQPKGGIAPYLRDIYLRDMRRIYSNWSYLRDIYGILTGYLLRAGVGSRVLCYTIWNRLAPEPIEDFHHTWG